MPNREFVSVSPIFAPHFTGKHELDNAVGSINQQEKGIFAEIYSWPQTTIERVKKRRVQLLAIDSTNSRSDIHEINYSSPNIFSLRRAQNRDVYILAGDIPTEMWEKPDDSIKLSRNAIIEHGKRVNRWIESDPCGDSLSTRIKVGLLKELLPEIGPISLLYPLSFLTNDITFPNLAIIPLYADSLKFILYKYFDTPNFERLFPQIIDSPQFPLIRRLVKPLTRPTDDLDIRNDLVCIKLADAQEAIGTGLTNKTPYALFGTTHAEGKNVWYHEKVRKNPVRNAIRSIIDRIYNDQPNGPQILQTRRNKIEKELGVFFGSTTLWRVGSQPRSMRHQHVARSLTNEGSYISPTIQTIVSDAINLKLLSDLPTTTT